MDNLCLYKLDNRETRLIFGGKGNALLKLQQWGYPVPETFAIPANLDTLPNFDSLPMPFPGPCIVRSSADREDQSEMSSAGAFSSIRVKNQAEWGNALQEVVQSILKTKNELGPAFRAGFIVQPWIETEKRGVIFSRDPRNLWSKTSVLEWLQGVPDLQVVDGEEKTEILRSDLSSLPAWSKKIFEVANELENRFRTPVDIEWGLKKDGSLVLFQCRPIGGPEAQFIRRHEEDTSIVWSRELAAERFPSCMTPMGWDIIEDGIPVNLESLHEYFGLKASHPRNLAYSDEGWIYHSESFFKIPGGLKINLFNFVKKRPLFFPKFAFCLPLLFIKKEKASAKIVEHLTDPLVRRVRRDMDEAMKIIPNLKKKLKLLSKKLDRDELKNEFVELTAYGKIFFKADLPIFLAKDTLGKVYQSLWLSERCEGNFLEHASRMPENISLGIWSNPEDASFSRRTWDVFYSATEEMKDHLSETQAPSRTKKKLPELPAPWKKRIARLHQWMMWDEEQHHYSGLFLEVTRNILLACGEHMVQNSVLNSADEVFFLKLPETKDYLAHPEKNFDYFKGLAKFRRKRWELRKQHTPIPIVPPSVKEVASKKTIDQKGMSPGVAEGKWLYLDELSDLSNLPKESFVLVTKTANPVWIPLFPKITAWVTERGGPLSHGFVAAREWGIPAVTAYDVDAIRALSEGKKITVDGTKGEVRWN